jgi:hypothetical protein
MTIFKLSAKEKERLDKWLKKHNKKCDDHWEFSQHLTYMFTPTGIGTIIEVKCSCGKKVGITDSSNW